MDAQVNLCLCCLHATVSGFLTIGSLLIFLADEDESRLTGPNAPQIIKCCPTKQMAVTSIDSPLKDMVESLLNALVVKYNGKQEDGMYTFIRVRF